MSSDSTPVIPNVTAVCCSVFWTKSLGAIWVLHLILIAVDVFEKMSKRTKAGGCVIFEIGGLKLDTR